METCISIALLLANHNSTGRQSEATVPQFAISNLDGIKNILQNFPDIDARCLIETAYPYLLMERGDGEEREQTEAVVNGMFRRFGLDVSDKIGYSVSDNVISRVEPTTYDGYLMALVQILNVSGRHFCITGPKGISRSDYRMW